MIRAALSGGVAALLLLALPVHAAAKKPVTPKPVLSAFQQEEAMGPAELIKRWNPIAAKASRRFGVPLIWINAVMRRVSGAMATNPSATASRAVDSLSDTSTMRARPVSSRWESLLISR